MDWTDVFPEKKIIIKLQIESLYAVLERRERERRLSSKKFGGVFVKILCFFFGEIKSTRKIKIGLNNKIPPAKKECLILHALIYSLC